ncbi:arrestin domain-containing protein 17 [Ditylenchus destructor]|uniref:Arrestin domain-containing protein 17 n=1 Tax=Ditylenchus destructor TaxID=166010 RepID=A0AAD4QX47_9BILA|nr:arrestin domain-containing protein 17 [Ditylenchus destructor]
MTELFRIELFNNQDVLFPGQTVNGRCILRLRERVKARAVVLYVVGKAFVQWVVHRTDRDSHGHETSHDDWYTAEVSYLTREFAVWLPPSPDYNYIEPGSYEWPFNFTLPMNCPPSFEGRHGYIRYWAHAKVDRPWRADDTTRVTFTVMPMFDLNMVPYAASPVNRQFSESVNVCCCYSKGRIGVTASLNKAGFVPGEKIFVRVEIANRSSKRVNGVEATLMQTVKNHAQYICHWDTKLECRCIKRNVNPIGVPPGSTRLSEHTIKIPPVVPTIGSNVCSIIQVRYSVQIRIAVSGAFTNDVKCKLPLLVGTIPAIQIKNPVPVPSRASMQPPSPITLSERMHPTIIQSNLE